MDDASTYRLHWREQADGGTTIRWRDVHGRREARLAALAAIRAAVDASVRVAGLSPDGSEEAHVLTGLVGLKAWARDAVMPTATVNGWATRLDDDRRRSAAAAEVKASLIAAHEAGLLELGSAARLAAALDLALVADRPEPRDRNASGAT
jgi:hypothetical protein